MNQIGSMRKAKKMSQMMLAEQMHTDRSTISKWETGAAMPTSARLPLLAEVLGCTIDELFDRSSPEEAQPSA